MNIIKLSPGQTRQRKVEHPLLDGSKLMSDEQTDHAINAGDRDALVTGHLFLVKVIVGRFLANWPESQRFEEDMVSEGVLALVTMVDHILALDHKPKNTKGMIYVKIRSMIEIMLNDSKSFFAPSRSKQWTNYRDGDPIDYNYTRQLNESLEGALSDYSPEYVDIMDELQFLASEDREAMTHIIYQCMETDHGILEEELTAEEIEAIDSIIKAISEMT